MGDALSIVLGKLPAEAQRTLADPNVLTWAFLAGMITLELGLIVTIVPAAAVGSLVACTVFALALRR